jgi:hypothetical protein
LLLQTVMGNEIFPSTSAKVYAFSVPTRQFPGKELNLALAAKAGIGITKVGTSESFPPAPGWKEELGRWTRTNFDLPEGSLVKIFLNKTVPFGQMRVNGNILIRMRSAAAYTRIGVILTGFTNATISRANFEGKFDILTPAEATALGASIPLHFWPSFDESIQRRAFEVTVLERETAPVATEQVKQVINSEGEHVAVKTVQRRRIMGV